MFDFACSQTSATSPLKTSLLVVSAKPLTSSTVVLRRHRERARIGDEVDQRRAADGRTPARSPAGCRRACSTRSPWMPAAVASAPKSGFFTSVPHGW